MSSVGLGHLARFSLGFGVPEHGFWQWNFWQYLPHDWPVGEGGDEHYIYRSQSSPVAWGNAIMPYTKSVEIFAGPGLPTVKYGVSNALPGPKEEGQDEHDL
ncbi:MAG: hypothetical protein KIT11_03420 [Fimbriimonadaceae bacterium]|nr:hypothetical protein [Fimbriimonadaceae bacterium]QYK57053.1 MAG: hypothetical protein KF733_06105 [Fimbriimonadaceae bacterium]